MLNAKLATHVPRTLAILTLPPMPPRLPAPLPSPVARQATAKGPVVARKLTRAHFAFMRGLIQGLPLRETWERYLQDEGKATDIRIVQSTIAWIRDAFAAAARRESRFGTARLVLFDVSAMSESEPLPSLEAFSLERGLEDFSHAEQVEAYEAEFGKASRRLARRGKLIDRQLDALRWLEELAVQPPQPQDAVAAWLAPNLAQRLESVGIVTVAQLAERLNGRGPGWHNAIPGIGRQKAGRILQWLRAHEDALQLSVGEHVELKSREVSHATLQGLVAPATDVRPLEKFLVPSDLDGSAGTQRWPAAYCLLPATNDVEAILAWMQSKRGATDKDREALRAGRSITDAGAGEADSQAEKSDPSAWLEELSGTQRKCRLEAERFLMWAVLERGKALSSITSDDCSAYLAFLADPQPAARWCGPRHEKRWSGLWRPFEGPLQPSSQRLAVTLLRNLYDYWVAQRYVMANPWSGISLPTGGPASLNTERSLTKEQWRFVLARADELPVRSNSLRLQLALRLLYVSGIRLAEAVAAQVGDMTLRIYEPDEPVQEPLRCWVLRVKGRAGKLREIPLPDHVVELLSLYLVSRGLDADPAAPSNQEAFVLGQASDFAELAPQLLQHHRPAGQDAKIGLGAATLYQQIKRHFRACADALQQQGDSAGAEQLRRASTHWLRHTHATHSLASGTDLKVQQDILGHASASTTAKYRPKAEERERVRAMAGFWEKK